MRGLGVVARVAQHQRARGLGAKRAAGLEQRQRIGLLARERVAAEHKLEIAVQALGGQQRPRKGQRLVGQAGQPQAGAAQQLQALGHAGVDLGGAAVDRQVVALVGIPGRLVERIAVHLLQRAAQQMLAALADGARDEGAIDARQAQLVEHQPERGDEVALGIDHGAVEIDDGGIEFARQQGQAEDKIRLLGKKKNPDVSEAPAASSKKPCLSKQAGLFGCTPIWSGIRGSNSRPIPWQGIALPTELIPHDG